MADDDNCLTGQPGDSGEAIYTAACEQLRINRVQRVIDGLSTTSLNLKYRCLGPLGAKALAAALGVSTLTTTTIMVEEFWRGAASQGAADYFKGE